MLPIKYRAQLQDALTCATWSSVPYIECQHALLATRWTAPNPPLVPEPDVLRYTMPPPFIFTRSRDDPGQPKSQDHRLHNIFFLWVCVRRKCLAHPEQWCKTTVEWKDLLSGAYFRALHPQGEEMDIDHFWKYGWGALFPGCEDQQPVPLYRGERLRPAAFQDTCLRKIIVYDVSLISIKYQFEQANKMLRGGDYAVEHLIKKDPSIVDFSCHPHPLSSSWLSEFELQISHWPQFKTAGLPLIEDGMPGEQEHTKRVLAHLQAYFQGVQDCLRTLPTMFFPYPPVEKWRIDACISL